MAATRSPVGRAFKGSLSGVRPDDLAATVIEAALDQVPELDRSEIDDLLLGCGAPGGYQGFNMARVVAVLLGLDQAGGTTVTRYCASSLQSTRMAMHAIRAGEGSVFISAGVEAVSQSRLGTSDSPPVAADADPRTGRPTRGSTRGSPTPSSGPGTALPPGLRAGRIPGVTVTSLMSTSPWGRRRRTWPRSVG